MEATGRSWIPHGTMVEKSERSGSTFRAKPCEVIHPEDTRTPMAANFPSGAHTPVKPTSRVAGIPKWPRV